jgi:hypothetical protein
MRVSDKRLLAVYQDLTHDAVFADDPRRANIVAEMRAVNNAKTNRLAAKEIEWWGWDSDQELISWVSRARKLFKEE